MRTCIHVEKYIIDFFLEWKTFHTAVADNTLTWRKHIQTKRQHLDHKLRAMSWLLGRRSQLSLSNKIFLYKCGVLKLVWTYGIQLWGCTKPSNTQILQRFQSKLLRTLANPPWYVSKLQLHTDLVISFVKAEIRRSSLLYHRRLAGHQMPSLVPCSHPPTSPEGWSVDGHLIYTPWPATNSCLLPYGPVGVSSIDDYSQPSSLSTHLFIAPWE